MLEEVGREEGLNSVQWWMKRTIGAISGGRSVGSVGRCPNIECKHTFKRRD